MAGSMESNLKIITCSAEEKKLRRAFAYGDDLPSLCLATHYHGAVRASSALLDGAKQWSQASGQFYLSVTGTLFEAQWRRRCWNGVFWTQIVFNAMQMIRTPWLRPVF